MLHTRGAVVKVEVSQDDIKGNQVFQHLLSIRRLGWGLAKLCTPPEQQVQLLTSYRRVTWWTVQCVFSKEREEAGRAWDKKQINTKKLKWPELMFRYNTIYNHTTWYIRIWCNVEYYTMQHNRTQYNVSLLKYMLTKKTLLFHRWFFYRMKSIIRFSLTQYLKWQK